MKKWPNPISKFLLYFILIFSCLITGCDKIANPPIINNQEIETTPTTFGTIIIQPQSQEVEENGSCSFIAIRDDNAQGIWYFISPDWDAQYNIESIKDYAPSLEIYTIDNNILRLNNIPRNLNGWNIYCAYPDEKITDVVTLTIKNLNNNEDIYLG